MRKTIVSVTVFIALVAVLALTWSLDQQGQTDDPRPIQSSPADVATELPGSAELPDVIERETGRAGVEESIVRAGATRQPYAITLVSTDGSSIPNAVDCFLDTERGGVHAIEFHSGIWSGDLDSAPKNASLMSSDLRAQALELPVANSAHPVPEYRLLFEATTHRRLVFWQRDQRVRSRISVYDRAAASDILFPSPDMDYHGPLPEPIASTSTGQLELAPTSEAQHLIAGSDELGYRALTISAADPSVIDVVFAQEPGTVHLSVTGNQSGLGRFDSLGGQRVFVKLSSDVYKQKIRLRWRDMPTDARLPFGRWIATVVTSGGDTRSEVALVERSFEIDESPSIVEFQFTEILAALHDHTPRLIRLIPPSSADLTLLRTNWKMRCTETSLTGSGSDRDAWITVRAKLDHDTGLLMSSIMAPIGSLVTPSIATVDLGRSAEQITENTPLTFEFSDYSVVEVDRKQLWPELLDEVFSISFEHEGGRVELGTYFDEVVQFLVPPGTQTLWFDHGAGRVSSATLTLQPGVRSRIESLSPSRECVRIYLRSVRKGRSVIQGADFWDQLQVWVDGSPVTPHALTFDFTDGYLSDVERHGAWSTLMFVDVGDLVEITHPLSPSNCSVHFSDPKEPGFATIVVAD